MRATFIDEAPNDDWIKVAAHGGGLFQHISEQSSADPTSAKYSDDQPRDEGGRWTTGGEGSGDVHDLRPTAPKSGGGRCYDNAFNYLMDKGKPDDRLVHGFPTLKAGPQQGEQYGHAWVERDDSVEMPTNWTAAQREAFGPTAAASGKVTFTTVIDPSLSMEKPSALPKELYYSMGHIDPSETRSFSKVDAIQQALTTKVYGSWAPMPKGGAVFGDRKGQYREMPDGSRVRLEPKADLEKRSRDLEKRSDKYSPDQPRDAGGRWSGGDGSMEPSAVLPFLAGRANQEYEQQTPLERKMIDQYTVGGHSPINALLRENRDEPTEWLGGAQPAEAVAAMQSAMAKSEPLPKELTVFRGINVMGGISEAVAPGALVEDKGFVSTSLIQSDAERFFQHGYGAPNRDDALFRIHVPAGTHALAGRQSESELILPAGSRFRVTAVTPGTTTWAPGVGHGGTPTFVDAEMVGAK